MRLGKILRIASRSSLLAKTQAYLVADAVRAIEPHCQFEFQFRESLGDKNLQDPLWKLPQKGVFTEDFLLDLKDDRCDVVVHSWKDLPTEERSFSAIVATLARDDQRDLLLFKKESSQKKNLRIFSSSPRRGHNLSRILPDFIPWECEVAFESVRGNVQTRVRKMREAKDIDGLIVAKAAIDRLLAPLPKNFVMQDADYLAERSKVAEYLRESLAQMQWMVLPLSLNPNAAAQGALGIEIRKDRKDLLDLFARVNDVPSFSTATAERKLLGQFGGGCHLSLGMAVLERDYGRITWVQGQSPNGDDVELSRLTRAEEVEARIKKLAPTSIWTSSDLEPYVQRQTLEETYVPPATAIYVAKAEVVDHMSLKAAIVWSSGIATWKKLAKRGYWCQGSTEGLGDKEDPRIEALAGSTLFWQKWTHAMTSSMKERDEDPKSSSVLGSYQVATYDFQLRGPLRPADRENIAKSEVLFWTSPQHFLFIDAEMPDTLIHKNHACGPGQTRAFLKLRLGAEPLIFLSPQQARETFSRGE